MRKNSTTPLVQIRHEKQTSNSPSQTSPSLITNSSGKDQKTSRATGNESTETRYKAGSVTDVFTSSHKNGATGPGAAYRANI